MKRVAVVGFGFMGMTHSLNILKISDLKLVAIVDVNLAAIEENLKVKTGNIDTGDIDTSDLDAVHKYSNLDDCFDKEEIDAVNICVHSNLHYEMTKKALLHNKDVFLEKPFCLDLAQAEELISLARERKKILMIGHVVRFMPPYQKLKQWIDSGEFGNLKFLSFSRFCGLPGWGQWKEKNVSNLSGGALFDLVIHDIDFAQYVLGVPSDIKCIFLPGSISKYDYVSAMWAYPDKKLHVKFDGGNTFHALFPFQAGYMAHFEKASIMFTSLKSDIIQIADNNSVREVPAGDAGEGYYNEIAYFSECLKNNVEPEECMPESSLLSVQLCYNHL
jgi:predicted dehydrogenase